MVSGLEPIAQAQERLQRLVIKMSPNSGRGGEDEFRHHHDHTQRPRRARTSKPKVKTGCLICKQRRIKCGEERPACNNCVRHQKDCTGYPPPGRRAGPFEEIRIAPKPNGVGGLPSRQAVPLAASRRVVRYQRKSTTRAPTPLVQTATPAVPVLLVRAPSINLPFTNQEGLYFQLFRERTANELSGFFDSVFWSRIVLQECHSEAAIRHAVVALGALYKTLDKATESPPSSPSARVAQDDAWAHWNMAIRQYSDALHTLVAKDGADSRTDQTRLMASVLLACFDSFFGHHKQAIRHIQSGLKLLDQYREKKREAFVPEPTEPVEEEIIQMFSRLAMQAKSYDLAFHFPHPFVVHLSGTKPTASATSPSAEGASPISLAQDPIPDRFPGVMAARQAWDTLCERIFRFMEYMFAHAQQTGKMGILPPSTVRYSLTFKEDIQAWSDAFDHILNSRTAPGVNSQEKACIAVLKMCQIMGTIIFCMTFSDNEMGFDDYTSQFRVIVELAAEVVGDEERRAAAKRCPDGSCQHRAPERDAFGGNGYTAYTARHIKPSFSTDLGIVPPLFVVATKCRHPLIRRQAIQLLRSSSRREGMWDSELAARIGMWVADIEEGDDALIAGPALSPLSPTAPATTWTNGLMEPGEHGEHGEHGGRRSELCRHATVGHDMSLSGYGLPIAEEKRVMVRAVEFDLRKRFALVQLGSRNVRTGSVDLKTRSARITW